MTNRTKLFADGNHEGPWARRFRDLCELHEADIGGHASLSEAETSLVRRCATIEVQLEQMEGRLSKGEEVDFDLYTRCAGHLRRLLETLGIKRVSRVVDHNPILDHFSRPPEREPA